MKKENAPSALEKQLENIITAGESGTRRTRTKKPKAPKAPKIVMPESVLAERQAQKMMKDMSRLRATQAKSPDQKSVREGVDIWKDTDFYFSVVFQSSAQKYVFLEAFSKMFGLGFDNVRSGDEVFSIFNGLKLAEKLNVKIPDEKMPAYVYPNLALKDLTLDGEEF